MFEVILGIILGLSISVFYPNAIGNLKKKIISILKPESHKCEHDIRDNK